MRVLKTRDPLLCKVIRHVSSHSDVMEHMWDVLMSESARMSRWTSEFVHMAERGVDTPDLLVEVIGTLANLTLPDVPWAELCEVGLVDLLHRLLVPSFSEDDVVLECVMLIGNIAQSREAAQHIAGSRLPSMLADLLMEKRDDEEIVLQLLFTFRCLLLYEEIREVILQDTELAQCIIRFAGARNAMVVDEAMKTLQSISDHIASTGSQSGASWAEEIMVLRFEHSNREWCRFLSREMMGGGAGNSPSAFYDGQPQDGHDDYCYEEEEEFAFHWAGGDAGDVQDLANRDWGAKDMESFMHSSRYVS